MQKLKLTFKQSGRTLEFDQGADRGKSILDICHDNGINLRAGCRNGYCQACKCELLEGEVKYYDPGAKPKQEGIILTCSTYPSTDLTLDA